MALNFPKSPSVGNTYSFRGITYNWDGYSWQCDVKNSVTVATREETILGVDDSRYVTPYGNKPRTYPLGAIAEWGGDAPPNYWAECNGQTTTGMRSEIQAIFGANLPDLRGEFVRGWDNGRGVDSGRAILSNQSEGYKSHNHTLTSSFSSAGSHSHTPSTTIYTYGGTHAHTRGSMNITGRFSLNVQGDNGVWRSFTGGFYGSSGHTGRMIDEKGDRQITNYNYNDMDTNFGGWTGNTSTNGSHNHTVSASLSSASGHTHTTTFSVGSTGASETVPRNVSLMYICFVG